MRLTKAIFSSSKSIVFAMQKYGFYAAKTTLLRCSIVITAIWLQNAKGIKQVVWAYLNK